MKYDLVKFHHWLLLSTFKSKWFEENIKLQIISLLSWFIYPEYRKSNSFFSVIKKNKFILILISIFILWTSFFFTFGKFMNITEETYRYVFVKGKEEKNVSKNYNITIRKFLEKIIIEDCNIENKKNLRELPDHIFFSMIEEVDKNEIPYVIFFKVIDHESGFLFIPNSEGSGAMGYCQIMPVTFKYFMKRVGVSSHTPISNIKMGAFLLKYRYNYHKSMGKENNMSWFLSMKDYAGGNDSMAKEIIKIYEK